MATLTLPALKVLSRTQMKMCGAHSLEQGALLGLPRPPCWLLRSTT